MTYYKATRPDGKDFYSGTIQYEVDKTVKPADSKVKRICGPGYLHASDALGMVLVGGRWPCKLFEVEGKPKVGFNEDHPHKGGFLELKVVKELPAHWALGPNGLIVAKAIERTAKATGEEIRALGAARDAAWDAARGEVWGAARGAAWDAARDAAWGAARDAAWDAARGEVWGAARGAAWDAARDAAWGAAWDAVLALLVKDLITQEHFDKLFGPWQEVMGEIE